ncbi:hypothetical protein AcV5_009991 [Taiwanofungus camphoratus]|nr:hypothetical protein AcV5_009991 [Antrodia cinnamomea]KAI0945877.1 hypothetical protein AcV7_009999 [Antrodia cinnamomea]
MLFDLKCQLYLRLRFELGGQSASLCGVLPSASDTDSRTVEVVNRCHQVGVILALECVWCRTKLPARHSFCSLSHAPFAVLPFSMESKCPTGDLFPRSSDHYLSLSPVPLSRIVQRPTCYMFQFLVFT